MITTVTPERLHKQGYEAMLDFYSKVSSQLNEPLYTRPAWFILSEVEGYSGERGAPYRLQAVRPSTRLGAVNSLLRESPYNNRQSHQSMRLF